jgi:hypothetical protein
VNTKLVLVLLMVVVLVLVLVLMLVAAAAAVVRVVHRTPAIAFIQSRIEKYVGQETAKKMKLAAMGIEQAL